MARTTIYVPNTLHARMQRVDDANWSRVAQEAFEANLNQRSRKRVVEDMTDVVERLRASKAEHSSEHYKWGREEGEQWAKQSADYAELMRLRRADLGGLADLEANDARCTVARTIIGEHEFDGRGDVSVFWESNAEDTDDADTDFYLGFVEGALSVLEEVRTQL